MTVDNLLGCEIVTADGSVTGPMHARARTVLGVARRWRQLRRGDAVPVPTASGGADDHGGPAGVPGGRSEDGARQYRAYVESTMPEDLNVWVVLRKAPPLPFLPASAHGKDVVVLAVFHDGDPAAAEKAIDPLRSSGRRWRTRRTDAVHRVAAGVRPAAGPGARNYWKSHNFTRLEDGAIDAMTDFAARLPSPLADIFVGQVGGVANRVAPDATAYHHRDARYVLNVHSRWERADEDAACIAWARDFFRATEPFATGGVYVNFLTEDETARIGAAYGPNYARLAQIKRTYDPQNLFSTNQNIAPAS
jgi:FAD/FMN-containing dehydrogenase